MTEHDVAALSPLKRALVEIRELRTRLASAERRTRGPVAIVGAGLRFPGGVGDLASYWQLLVDGVDAITDVPADRWPVDELYDSDPDAPGRVVTRRGGFVGDLDRFDARFFSMSPREAESLDPQQRMVLEVAWEALEDANIPADGLFGSRVGVFVGIGHSDYMRLLLADPDRIDTYTTTGSALSVAAGRVAYVLGTHGPAIAVDTACSSSLVAVHLAVQSLRSGECDVAIAGGVNAMLAPELTINFSRARMMAPDGRCKAFDAGADGYVRAEGCGLVVLKRLDDAVAADDRVLAVVRGSAVNQDGRSSGLTAPNGPAQEAVIRDALDDAGIAPLDVGYVETHGTGTLLGDPIEVGALGAALCSDRDASRPLMLGSVKTNIGHTETAAGIAGLLKAVLVLEHGEVPPHLHLRELNPHIAAAGFPIVIPTTRSVWPEPPAGRIAGVSSFGLSGTNAHVVLSGPPVAAGADPATTASTTESTTATANVVTISARSPEALVELAARTAQALRDQPEHTLAEVARSANTGRSGLEARRAIVGESIDETIAQLEAIAAAGPTSPPPTAGASGVAFLFSGHGTLQGGMGAELYRAEPVFAAAIDRCARLLGDRLGRPLTTALFEPTGDTSRMAVAQPALFALQFALAELWTSWGVRPTMVAGHSAGEYAAAVHAGVLDLDDGLRVIAERGRLMDTLEPGGSMVALFVDEPTVAAAVAATGGQVGIAAVNGPRTTVIAGRSDDVELVIDALGVPDDDVRRLAIPIAAHSPLVEPILDRFAAVFDGMSLRPPVIGLVSTMHGRLVTDETSRAAYWREHLRSPVRFADALDTMRASGCSAFVEIGPGSTLVDLGRRAWPDDRATWIASMRGGDEQRQLLDGLGRIYERGVAVDWAGFADHPGRRGVGRPVRLPTYPWQRERAWSAAAERHPARAPTAIWPAAVAAARRQSEIGPLDLEPGRYADRWARFDRLATLAIERALAELGVLTEAGAELEAADLVDRGAMLPSYQHLAGRWLAHLADTGRLRRVGDRYVADTGLSAVDLAPVLDELRGLEGLAPLVDYMERCCNALAAVVSGREPALSTLFPAGSYDTVEFIYRDWAVPRYFNGIVAAAVSAAAAALGGRPLRVLEIGAGSGGTTAAVLPALPPGTSYRFTDVSDFFVTRAAERFAGNPGVTYGRLDIERSPAAQGIAPGSFDVVVAANVLHATADLDRTLGHVRSVLAGGGVLVLYESTSHPSWFDVSTGLIEGWQRFDDSWRSEVPLVDTATWRAALGAAGFEEIEALPGDGSPTSALLQHVLLARAPAAAMGELPATEVGAAEVHLATDLPPVAPPTIEVRAELDSATEAERLDIVVGAVRRAIGSVLRIGDPARLPREQPLLDLGFDSLMAVELRDVLRRSFGLDSIPATVVFDHPTIEAIAIHLDTLLRTGDARAGAGGEPAVVEQAPGRLDPATVVALTDDEAASMLLARLEELGS